MKKTLIISLLLGLSLTSHANQQPQSTTSTQSQPTQSSAQAEGENTENPENKDTPAPPKDIPANPHDPANGTYLQSIMPNDSELSKANTELLAKNTELTRQIESLNTQVNVLVQERTNQLFVYGGMTGVVSLVIGFVLAKLTSRQGRW